MVFSYIKKTRFCFFAKKKTQLLCFFVKLDIYAKKKKDLVLGSNKKNIITMVFSTLKKTGFCFFAKKKTQLLWFFVKLKNHILVIAKNSNYYGF